MSEIEEKLFELRIHVLMALFKKLKLRSTYEDVRKLAEFTTDRMIVKLIEKENHSIWNRFKQKISSFLQFK